MQDLALTMAAKLRLAGMALSCLALLGSARTPDPVALELSLSGLRSASGEVRLCIWHGPSSSLGEICAGQSVVVPAVMPDVTVSLRVVPGDYAVSLFHDENGNGKLDTNSFGIPMEGFGFSQNPQISFGPPTYAATHFNVAGPHGEAIRMRYLL